MLAAQKTPDEYFANRDSTAEDLVIAQLLKRKNISKQINEIKKNLSKREPKQWSTFVGDEGLTPKERKDTKLGIKQEVCILFNDNKSKKTITI